MGARAIELGAAGRTVATQVRLLRTEQKMTLVEVAEEMTGYGRPMQPSGISRIEDGTRRVDVDDLMVLARILKVTPHDLMGWNDDNSEPRWLSPEQIEENLEDMIKFLEAQNALVAKGVDPAAVPATLKMLAWVGKEGK